MRWLKILRLRLRSLFSRDLVEQELDEELRYHLERDIQAEVAAGKTPEEARFAALRSIANLEQRREECRDQRNLNLISNLSGDVRYAIRQLFRHPGFTLTALLVSTLGLCSSVAVFAFVDGALIRPLPYRDPARLVAVFENTAQCPRCNLSYLDFVDWRKQNNVFQSLEAYRNTGFILTTASGAQATLAARVSAGFFRTLGVRPVLGRDFHSGEDQPGAPHAVLLSHAAWQKRFGAKPEIVGKAVTLDGENYLVIGVLPRDFHFAPTRSAEFWATVDSSAYCEKRRGCHDLFGIARLKQGVSLEKAHADIKIIARRLEKEYPDSNRGQSANALALTATIVGEVRPILLLLLGGASLLLLIAYVNTASLLLVRSESRRREIAVRRALGAANARLFTQFLIESFILVGGSTILGLALARLAIELLTKLIPAPMLAGMPYLQGLGFNRHVLVFTACVSLFAIVLFALTPVLHFSWSGLSIGLHEGSRGSAGLAWRRLGSKLVAVELAAAVVLWVGAGLLSRSLHNLLTVDLGFDPDHIATMLVVAPPKRYGNSKQQLALMRQIESTVTALPGVESAGSSSVLPVSYNGNTDWIRFVGRPYNGQHNEVNEREVSSQFFKTVHARILRGRAFAEDEDLSKPKVAIINAALADKYFARENPIRKQIGNISLDRDSIRTIVGVVDNIREGSLDTDIWPTEYLPSNQEPDNVLSLIVRTHQPEHSLSPVLVRTIHTIDREIVTLDEVSMDEHIQNSAVAYLHRSAAWLVSSFATIALLLGVVGLYGVVTYSVGQRTREIGVRMALGAETRAVYRLILGEVASLVLVGAGAGLLCALLGARFARQLLFGVRIWDPPTLASVTGILILATLLASFMPARRAASVDPVEALRVE